MKKIILSYAIAMSAIFSMTSCQKDQNINPDPQEIKFYASYNGETQTKATSVFTTGNKVTILGYTAGATVTSATSVPGTPVEATGGASGLLTPSAALYLPKGSYDFYSVSLNNTTAPGLTFTSGMSTQLTNGIDYLWTKAAGIAEGGTASFIYNHKAVGMEVNVSAGTGVSALSVTAISFTPTTASTASKMSLADGSIGAASVIGSLTPMSLSGTKGTYIMLPVGSVAVNVEITVNATIGGTTVTAKKYTATIPSQAYTSGSYYTANFTVSSTALQFTGAQVQDWTNQTISGVLLTEQ